MTTVPFVEKYRPDNINDIILNHVNRTIINNIIKYKIYPNLLLYGPPGTGKTTTIINMVNTIQNDKNKSLLLHLNASDERGIDTIRNQIAKFINSKPLFSKGIKFIILDEVDYMTKSAQQALKYLLQQYNNKAVFCLMCNYISKIDVTLKNEFIELKFNKLPNSEITLFLKKLCLNEKISINESDIIKLQAIYKYDIRSMINYIQLNYFHNDINNQKLLTKEEIMKLYNKLKTTKITDINKEISDFCIYYNVPSKYIFISLLYYLIKDRKITDSKLISKFELVIHEDQYNIFENNYILKLLSLID